MVHHQFRSERWQDAFQRSIELNNIMHGHKYADRVLQDAKEKASKEQKESFLAWLKSTGLSKFAAALQSAGIDSEKAIAEMNDAMIDKVIDSSVDRAVFKAAQHKLKVTSKPQLFPPRLPRWYATMHPISGQQVLMPAAQSAQTFKRTSSLDTSGKSTRDHSALCLLHVSVHGPQVEVSAVKDFLEARSGARILDIWAPVRVRHGKASNSAEGSDHSEAAEVRGRQAAHSIHKREESAREWLLECRAEDAHNIIRSAGDMSAREHADDALISETPHKQATILHVRRAPTLSAAAEGDHVPAHKRGGADRVHVTAERLRDIKDAVRTSHAEMLASKSGTKAYKRFMEARRALWAALGMRVSKQKDESSSSSDENESMARHARRVSRPRERSEWVRPWREGLGTRWMVRRARSEEVKRQARDDGGEGVGERDRDGRLSEGGQGSEGRRREREMRRRGDDARTGEGYGGKLRDEEENYEEAREGERRREKRDEHREKRGGKHRENEDKEKGDDRMLRGSGDLRERYERGDEEMSGGSVRARGGRGSSLVGRRSKTKGVWWGRSLSEEPRESDSVSRSRRASEYAHGALREGERESRRRTSKGGEYDSPHHGRPRKTRGLPWERRKWIDFWDGVDERRTRASSVDAHHRMRARARGKRSKSWDVERGGKHRSRHEHGRKHLLQRKISKVCEMMDDTRKAHDALAGVGVTLDLETVMCSNHSLDQLVRALGGRRGPEDDLELVVDGVLEECAARRNAREAASKQVAALVELRDKLKREAAESEEEKQKKKKKSKSGAAWDDTDWKIDELEKNAQIELDAVLTMISDARASQRGSHTASHDVHHYTTILSSILDTKCAPDEQTIIGLCKEAIAGKDLAKIEAQEIHDAQQESSESMMRLKPKSGTQTQPANSARGESVSNIGTEGSVPNKGITAAEQRAASALAQEIQIIKQSAAKRSARFSALQTAVKDMVSKFADQGTVAHKCGFLRVVRALGEAGACTDDMVDSFLSSKSAAVRAAAISALSSSVREGHAKSVQRVLATTADMATMTPPADGTPTWLVLAQAAGDVLSTLHVRESGGYAVQRDTDYVDGRGERDAAARFVTSRLPLPLTAARDDDVQQRHDKHSTEIKRADKIDEGMGAGRVGKFVGGDRENAVQVLVEGLGRMLDGRHAESCHFALHVVQKIGHTLPPRIIEPLVASIAALLSPKPSTLGSKASSTKDAKKISQNHPAVVVKSKSTSAVYGAKSSINVPDVSQSNQRVGHAHTADFRAGALDVLASLSEHVVGLDHLFPEGGIQEIAQRYLQHESHVRAAAARLVASFRRTEVAPEENKHKECKPMRTQSKRALEKEAMKRDIVSQMLAAFEASHSSIEGGLYQITLRCELKGIKLPTRDLVIDPVNAKFSVVMEQIAKLFADVLTKEALPLFDPNSLSRAPSASGIGGTPRNDHTAQGYATPRHAQDTSRSRASNVATPRETFHLRNLLAGFSYMGMLPQDEVLMIEDESTFDYFLAARVSGVLPILNVSVRTIKSIDRLLDKS